MKITVMALPEPLGAIRQHPDAGGGRGRAHPSVEALAENSASSAGPTLVVVDFDTVVPGVEASVERVLGAGRIRNPSAP